MIPHLFKEPIPEIIDIDLKRAIAKVKGAPSKKEALEKAFGLITEKYEEYRFHTLFLWRALEADPNTLWGRPGFMHCTQQNFLLRVLLVKSGWFSEEDIALGYSLIWYFSPHQYLVVKLDGRLVALDPWNYRFGATIGKYAFGFGVRTL